LELRYLQEHEGVFVDVAGLKLKRSEVQYGKPPALESFKTISFGVDPAVSTKTSADYTGLAVCGIDGNDRRWILHLAHWRSSWAETERKLLGFYAAWRPHTVIFEAVCFASIGANLLLDAGMAVRPIVPHKDKMTRFERLHVRYATAAIWHSETLDQECENELYAFDSGSHDDVVDAVVYGMTPLFPELSTDWTGERWSQWGSGVAGSLPHEVEAAKALRSKRMMDRWREEQIEAAKRPRLEIIQLENGRTYGEWRRPSEEEIAAATERINEDFFDEPG
jgi:phage terminase large subunit-like protein